VFNRKNERVRGLWERNGVFYAQLKVGGASHRFRVENANTVPDAVTGMQSLKKQAKDGTLKPPGTEETVGQETQNVGQTQKHTLAESIDEYQR
jgi:hypothetical protein